MRCARALATRVPPAWRAAAFWGAVWAVLALSLTPVQNLPSVVFDVWDKAQHALGFAGLALLGAWAYPRRWARLALGLLAFGAFIEVAQAATGWRQGDVLDWLADALGVAVVLVTWRAVSGRCCAKTGESPPPRR